MAVKNDPTAANILSSLQISGASAKGGLEAAGAVPVLNASGKLDKSFIPLDAISQEISLPPLDQTAYVDATSEAETPDGSIAKPFRTVTEAARKGFTTFILSPGSYGETDIDFHQPETNRITLLGTGRSEFTRLTLRNYKSNSNIVLVNVSVSSELKMASNVPSNLYLLGFGSYSSIVGTLSIPDDPVIADKYLNTVGIGPCVTIAEPPTTAEALVFLATDSRIANTTSILPGGTVKDALMLLRETGIVIPVFSAVVGDAGIAVSFETKSVSSDLNSYDLRRIGTTLTESINQVFYHRGSNLDVGDIDAAGDIAAEGSVSATDVIATTKVVTPKIQLGDIFLRIDDEGFLVIEEE